MSYDRSEAQRYDVPFEVFTLPAWQGRQYLDFFQVDPQGGGAVSEVWLGHTGEHDANFASDQQFLLLGTFSPNHPGFRVTDPECFVAHEALIRLVNIRLPSELPHPDGLIRRVHAFVESESQQNSGWAQGTITVNGETASTRYVTFADGVAAIVTVEKGLPPIAVVAYGVELAQVSIESGGWLDYGVDLSAGLEFSDLAGGSLTSSESRYHPDFHAFF